MAAKKSKSSKARKAPAKSRRSKPKAPPVVVSTHHFPPGTKVGFNPAHEVTVERNLNREPFAKPAATAKVGKEGTLEVSGLPKGAWLASGEVDGQWRYVQFQVS